jgi:O-antigen/teichoic acid export membrane protein
MQSDPTSTALNTTLTAAMAAVRSAKKQLIGASFIIVQPLLLNALSLPVTAYIIATLGATDYGAWAVALTLVTTGSILTNLGLRAFFIRAVAQHPETAARLFAEQLGLRMTLALLAGGLSLLVCHALKYPHDVWQCTAVLATGAVFTAAGAVVSDLFAATERLPALATINMVAGLTLTGASALAMWLGLGLPGLAASYLLGPILSGTLSLAHVHRRMFRVRVVWSPDRFWQLLKQGKVLGLQLFVMNLGNHAENLLVPKMVGLSEYGFFAAGTLLPRRLEIVPDGLNTAFYPALAKSYHESPMRARATVKRLALFMTAACVPAAVAMFVLAGPIAQLLFPRNPDICQTVIRLTVWWVPLIGFAYGMGYVLNAAGREKDEATLAITSTLISLAVSVVLIVKFGLIGACAALVAKAGLAVAIRIPTTARTFAHPSFATTLEPQVEPAP